MHQSLCSAILGSVCLDVDDIERKAATTHPVTGDDDRLRTADGGGPAGIRRAAIGDIACSDKPADLLILRNTVGQARADADLLFERYSGRRCWRRDLNGWIDPEKLRRPDWKDQQIADGIFFGA